ncbi:hypothetical protein MAR_014460, partial [Mya arenaria]
DNSINPPLTYAYVEKINQTFFIRFAQEGDLRKSLCAGDTLPSTAYGNTTYTDQTQAPTLSTPPISLPVSEETTAFLDKNEGGACSGLALKTPRQQSLQDNQTQGCPLLLKINNELNMLTQ